MSTSAAALYPDWPRYGGRILDVVSGLGPDQLAIRAGEGHAPVWALAAHVAGTRVYWMCGVIGEPGAERTPFPAPLTDEGWEDDESHPRTGTELAWALGSSFQVVTDALWRWSVDDLALTAERRIGGTVQVHSRASVLNRLLGHDAYHAGEISQLLGVHGVGALDLWARPAPPAPGDAMIWHLARTTEWVAAQARGLYTMSTRDLTLEQVGFIHCSFAHQLPGVAERFYADETAPLTLLGIDRTRLEAAGVVARDEPGDPAHPDAERFPHIYGAVPVDAVTHTYPATVVDGRLVAPGWSG